MTLFATLGMPVPLIAQVSQDGKHEHHHYKLVQIGTFGGSQSFNEWAGVGYRMMNSRGIATGQADTPASDPNCIGMPDSCAISYAFLWQDGALTNLGGLPGDTEGSYAASVSDRGWITGFSGNGLIDDQTGFPELVAVLWKDGKIKDLGTLGGNASAASGINNRGQIVGAALNTIPDAFSTGFPSPLCGGVQCIAEIFGALIFPSATQMHAVVWQNGTIKDLGTLGGPDSFASQVNERGQIAGESYIDSTPNGTTGVPTIDAFFIGEDGKMVDLGNLGGTFSSVTALNNRGQVIGAMTVPGDTGFHPFLWDHGVLTDLGTFGFDCGIANAINDSGEIVGQGCSSSTIFSPSLWRDGLMINLGTVEGDLCGEAYGINSQGQVVGESGNCGNPGPNHAWLWEEDGPAIDLNKLIPPNSGIRLGHAISINDRGEIAGTGALPNGDHRAFVLIPCDENHAAVEDCDYSLVDDKAATQPRPAPAASEATFSPAEMTARTRSLLAGRNRWFGTAPPALLEVDRFTASPQTVTSDAAVISGPSATLSPTSLTFSTQAIDTTGAAKTVALKNTGTTTLTISGVAITGTNAGDFSQTHTCGSQLAAGASCSISVTFKPTASGTRAAALSVTDNAAGSPQKVSLTGIGTTAKFAPTSFNFGTVVIGTSLAKAVTLTNVGTTALTISGVAITGTNAGDFSQTHTCGSSLAAGASCSISVTFKPTASGTRAAALSVADNAAGSPQKVPLSGISVELGTVTLSPASMGFSCHFGVGPNPGCSSPLTAMLRNAGATPVYLQSITVGGTNFAEQNNCPIAPRALAPGQSCAITVSYTPTHLPRDCGVCQRRDTSTVDVHDTASGSPQSIALTGDVSVN